MTTCSLSICAAALRCVVACALGHSSSDAVPTALAALAAPPAPAAWCARAAIACATSDCVPRCTSVPAWHGARRREPQIRLSSSRRSI
tara:strand:- start:1345 stop:1608 length:264 start_codon:yes stop_codon:yes gene_type:complete